MKKTFFSMALCLIFFIFLFTGCNKKIENINTTPVVTAILPTAASSGETVTIYGKNFLADISKVKVTVNNKQAAISAAFADSIKFIVPASAGSGQVVVTIGDNAFSGPAFTYNYKVVVTTIAGTGVVGAADGPANQCSFNCPWGITVDDNGDLYVADVYNRYIRKITAGSNMVSTIDPGSIDFASPYNLALNKTTHDLYATDFNLHVLKVAASGDLSLIYTGIMPTTGIALGPDGNLYVTNNTNGTLMKMDTDGGNQSLIASGMVTPRNIVFDKDGAMYVSAYGIYKINNGNAAVVDFDDQCSGWEVAMDNAGNFYEADHFNNRIRKIDVNGNATTIAGSGIAEDVDGIGLDASFNGPQGITIDNEGNLYVTTYNYDNATGNKVRKISFQ